MKDKAKLKKSGNKLIISLQLSANALDFQGEPVADGTLKVHGLSILPHGEAYDYYKKISDLIDELDSRVKHYEKVNRIAELKAELKELE